MKKKQNRGHAHWSKNKKNYTRTRNQINKTWSANCNDGSNSFFVFWWLFVRISLSHRSLQHWIVLGVSKFEQNLTRLNGVVPTIFVIVVYSELTVCCLRRTSIETQKWIKVNIDQIPWHVIALSDEKNVRTNRIQALFLNRRSINLHALIFCYALFCYILNFISLTFRLSFLLFTFYKPRHTERERENRLDLMTISFTII